MFQVLKKKGIIIILYYKMLQSLISNVFDGPAYNWRVIIALCLIISLLK